MSAGRLSPSSAESPGGFGLAIGAWSMVVAAGDASTADGSFDLAVARYVVPTR